MIDWDSLNDFNDWAGALDVLLDDAATAASSSDVAVQVAVQKQLRTFRKKSPNESCRKLDEIAKQAIFDLAKAAVEDAITGIASRSSELDDYVKDLAGVTAQAERTAKWLSLESPTEIAKSLTDVVVGLKDIKAGAEDITSPEQAEDLVKKVESAMRAVSKLRDTIESA